MIRRSRLRAEWRAKVARYDAEREAAFDAHIEEQEATYAAHTADAVPSLDQTKSSAPGALPIVYAFLALR